MWRRGGKSISKRKKREIERSGSSVRHVATGKFASEIIWEENRVAVGVECGSNSIEMATAMVPFTEQRFVRKLWHRVGVFYCHVGATAQHEVVAIDYFWLHCDGVPHVH